MTDVDLIIPADEDPAAAAIDWLWRPYLSFGSLAALDGDPGVGKSFVALDLAARLSAGLPMPDGSPPSVPEGLRILVASGDDVIEDTLVPRFVAAGGVRERLSFFGGLSRRRPNARLAEFPRDLEALALHLSEVPVGLAVLDPISVLFPGVAANSDVAVREALAPFAQLAAEFGTCFLLLRHLNKSGGGKSLYRGCGSIGIAAATRSALLAGVHPDDPDRRVLSVTKANLGERGRSIGFRLAEREGGFGVVWDGPTNLTADDLCRMRGEDDGPSRKAEKWLFYLLAKGPVPAATVETEAQALGIGFTTLKAAKKRLGVESRRVKRDGRERWEWGWPEGGLAPLEPL